MALEPPPLRKILLAGTLMVLVSAIGRLGYEAWRNPEVFRSRFQRWHGSEKVAVQVTRLDLRRVEDHVQLTITGNFRQTTASPLRLEPPLVILHAAGPDGAPHPVERFTGAFLEDPVLPPAAAGAPASVPLALHYWLPLADLAGVLSLTVDGESAALKNEPGFSVDSLPNGQTVGLSFPGGKILTGPTSF